MAKMKRREGSKQNEHGTWQSRVLDTNSGAELSCDTNMLDKYYRYDVCNQMLSTASNNPNIF